jgi:hypothetical protein
VVFEEWADDWAWDSWLEREFKHTAGGIAEEMRKRWTGWSAINILRVSDYDHEARPCHR